jgi:polyadenylate-binding protein
MLYEHFKVVGSILSARVCQDSSTRKSLGYGYVNFQNPAEAQKAIEVLNGSRILDKPCRIMPVQRDPTLRKSGVANIIIKNIPPDFDHGSLMSFFGRFGKITSVKLATDEKGNPRGYAYVNFEKEEAATQAVNEANNSEVAGKVILVERFRPRQAMQEELMKKFTNLYIKNIDPSIDDQKLAEIFGKFGEIDSCVIMKNEDGNSKGFGFVSYKQHDAAVAAVEEYHGKPLYAREGSTLYVGRAQSKRERQMEKERRWRERQAQYAKYPNLYIKNLDDTVTEEQLREAFERFGPTESVRIARDSLTKVSKGFGFVSFKEHAHAQKAMQEMAGSTLIGMKPLYIAYAQKRDLRRQQLEEMQKKRQRFAANPFGGPQAPGLQGGPQINPMLPPQFYGPQMSQLGYGGQMQQGQFGQMPMRPGMPMPQPSRIPMGGMPPQGGILPGMMQRLAPTHPLQQPVRPMAPMPKPAMPVQPIQRPMQAAIDAQYLASLSAEQQKNVLGERLYTYIHKRQPEQSSKITGMLLEMDNSEILNMLDTPELLDSKINEAVEVLQHHSGAM